MSLSCMNAFIPTSSPVLGSESCVVPMHNPKSHAISIMPPHLRQADVGQARTQVRHQREAFYRTIAPQSQANPLLRHRQQGRREGGGRIMSGSDQANMASTSTTTTSVRAESALISAACNSFSQCLVWANGVLPADEVRRLEWKWGREVDFALRGGSASD